MACEDGSCRISRSVRFRQSSNNASLCGLMRGEQLSAVADEYGAIVRMQAILYTLALFRPPLVLLRCHRLRRPRKSKTNPFQKPERPVCFGLGFPAPSCPRLTRSSTPRDRRESERYYTTLQRGWPAQGRRRRSRATTPIQIPGGGSKKIDFQIF